jgi:hypothetical protein
MYLQTQQIDPSRDAGERKSADAMRISRVRLQEVYVAGKTLKEFAGGLECGSDVATC